MCRGGRERGFGRWYRRCCFLPSLQNSFLQCLRDNLFAAFWNLAAHGTFPQQLVNLVLFHDSEFYKGVAMQPEVLRAPDPQLGNVGGIILADDIRRRRRRWRWFQSRTWLEDSIDPRCAHLIVCSQIYVIDPPLLLPQQEWCRRSFGRQKIDARSW